MKIKRIKLLNFGSITAADEQMENNKKSLSGYFLYPSSISFIEKTDTLKGKVGLKFGIEYFIEGEDKTSKNDEAIFYCRIKHPELVNPASNEKASETIERKLNWLNTASFDYYSFEQEWEVQPGTWTFQIMEGDNLLLERFFEIK